ncbi:MAG: hypothetical protein A2275_11405 [Bacteroidetes bacterium RIFOXYA12_FULL_35_11]|nr:MAG: hypothetical protein A2X01_14380 [Bacteroidetes bacterium GWF2_35_48]OFY73467.1 MAG: hypothetical protein A2275_11405 [Bacteroidetes bacterium RIFOXYA12_FULL_35_11]OFY93175.1 MAG: hypothetical protein A2491_14510 [Bacteroidetes bacterium RIFOXYC12_FULL_35_7]OFY95517.1 MAG: hypothetical protein A2309_11070 [Bacteroidetes bacterium RIFOXYB2_FULL_35_7]HBX52289.1 hypothetical protein [Bacteroidales bacterium]
MRFIFLFFIFLFSAKLLCAQEVNKYWIFFSDKKSSTFDPFSYFDSKAIERRVVNNIPLYDSTDFPISEKYFQIISANSDSILVVSRWFNAVAVLANSNQIDSIENFSFVKQITKIRDKGFVSSYGISDNEKKEPVSDLQIKQLAVMGSKEFEKSNLTGKNVRIAIFDAGFPGVDKMEAFEHIRDNNRIIKTYDFVKKKENVYKYNSHGTMVLSCIAGVLKEKKTGLAIDAEFLLARTEQATEPFSEEENWLAAVEWADKNGAQIINSSLGYTEDRYFNEDMNGQTSLVSRAATIAARKGILVVNAMGNDGSDSWKILGAPADADSILSVGGIDPATGLHINFSSYGPTKDKRLKPNVSAFGDVIVVDNQGQRNAQGTSFASPLVAGFAACAFQSNPSMKAMDLLKEIEKSGHLYPYFDYAHGYGIPQASYFTDKTEKAQAPTFQFVNTGNTVSVICKETIETAFNMYNYLYYHIQDKNGFIEKYAVIEVYQAEALAIPFSVLENNKTLRVHFKGYTGKFTLNK